MIMVKKKINILRKSNYDDEDTVLKDYYGSWRVFNQNISEGYVALFNSFKNNLLKELDGGALRLYIYFSLHANNSEGHSWHSIDTIANYFDVQTRTVDNWISILTEKGLIYRAKKSNKSYTTYLLPYSETLIELTPTRSFKDECQDLIDDFIKNIKSNNKIYGDIINVFHLFQWKKVQGSTKMSIQWVLINTKRGNGILVTHYYQFRGIGESGVNNFNINETYSFKSPYTYMSKPIIGLAIDNTHKIDDPKNCVVILDIIRDLSTINEANLEDYPILEYGKLVDQKFQEGEGT